MNNMLRDTTDELIDLIDQMLCKDPVKRIAMMEVYEHPWIVKYKYKDEKWSDRSANFSSSKHDSSLKSVSSENLSEKDSNEL